MRFDTLCAVAHNLTDSFMSGYSGLFGGSSPIIEAVDAAPDRPIDVDMRTGRVLTEHIPEALVRFAALAPQALAELCAKHDITPEAFRRLDVRFERIDTNAYLAGIRFAVTVEDATGRTRTDIYHGLPGKRVPAGKHPPVA